MSDRVRPLIGLAAERPLTRTEAETAFAAFFEGEATPSQMGGLLMALRTRGETVEEYAAAASAMRARCNAVRAPEGAIDIVGTGGDGTLQRLRVELLAHLHQRMQGGVEDLQAEVGDRVILVNRELAEAGAGSQALRQLQLEVLEAAATDGATEAHDGRLADADTMRQLGHGAVHHRCRIEQDVIGHLELGLAQQVARLGDVLQQIHGNRLYAEKGLARHLASHGSVMIGGRQL